MIEKIDSTLFDWISWRSGSPLDFFVPCRESALVEIRPILRRYAIGYCIGENLLCRPKLNHKAVMFFKNDLHFWFHLTNREFERIFL